MTIWDIPGGQYLFCTINLKNGMFNFDSLYSLLKHWIYSLTDLIYNFKSAPPPAYLLPPSPTIAPTPPLFLSIVAFCQFLLPTMWHITLVPYYPLYDLVVVYVLRFPLLKLLILSQPSSTLLRTIFHVWYFS